MNTKKTSTLLTLTLALLLFAGCSSTTVTKTTYDSDGAVAATEVTETNESPIVIAFSNLENKHVLAHMGGWYASIGVDPSSNTYGIGAGTLDNTYASIVADSKLTDTADIVQYFPAIVDASEYSLSITKDGINSESSTTTVNEATDDESTTQSTSTEATESE